MPWLLPHPLPRLNLLRALTCSPHLPMDSERPWAWALVCLRVNISTSVFALPRAPWLFQRAASEKTKPALSFRKRWVLEKRRHHNRQLQQYCNLKFSTKDRGKATPRTPAVRFSSSTCQLAALFPTDRGAGIQVFLQNHLLVYHAFECIMTAVLFTAVPPAAAPRHERHLAPAAASQPEREGQQQEQRHRRQLPGQQRRRCRRRRRRVFVGQ